ncbi:MAG: hypothetical protein EBR82_72090 [Caulobacteraceae bacterium]|nr:hypothetical protein [Caulobacteraceae bacterium]
MLAATVSVLYLAPFQQLAAAVALAIFQREPVVKMVDQAAVGWFLMALAGQGLPDLRGKVTTEVMALLLALIREEAVVALVVLERLVHQESVEMEVPQKHRLLQAQLSITQVVAVVGQEVLPLALGEEPQLLLKKVVVEMETLELQERPQERLVQ